MAPRTVRTARSRHAARGVVGAVVCIALATVHSPTRAEAHPGSAAPPGKGSAGPAPTKSASPGSGTLLGSPSGPGPFWGTSCHQAQDASSPYFSPSYVYGATNVNAQVGNGSLTIDASARGTVTVLRSIAANDENQVGYFATGNDPRTGAVLGARPNAGSFLGIRYTLGSGPHAAVGFAWLRSWSHEQRYLTSDAPVAVTTYTAPANLGLTVRVLDFATGGNLHLLDPAVPSAGPDAFVRDVTVQRAAGSPVSSASLVAYGNWNPIASDVPYVSFEDAGCSEQTNTAKLGAYVPSTGVVTVGWSGVDLATGRPSSAVVAMGFDEPLSSYEVGTDSEDPLAPPGPPDGFAEPSAAPYELGDSPSAAGQVTVALTRPLGFDRDGVAHASVAVAVAPSASQAVANVVTARGCGASALLRATLRAWNTVFRAAPSPARPTRGCSRSPSARS